MPVIVNDYELTDADMEKELPAHEGTADAMKSAMTALVLRRVLLDEAQQQGMQQADEDERIDALLRQEVIVPIPAREECLRQYQANPARFKVGELAEVSHILLQVTPGVDLDALRKHAQLMLDELLENPAQFAACAKANSNCPSSEVAGSLGQVTRGMTVPEFEQAVFAAEPGHIIPRLVETRFGLHIILLGRKLDGQLLPFEETENKIALAMQKASHDRALHQYLQLLVGRARISGVDIQGAATPLVQ